VDARQQVTLRADSPRLDRLKPACVGPVGSHVIPV
jgi:hypothetical protein